MTIAVWLRAEQFYSYSDTLAAYHHLFQADLRQRAIQCL